MQGWYVIWHCYELLFLLYGMRLCYKVGQGEMSGLDSYIYIYIYMYVCIYIARNSDWLERWQFTVAVCLEAVITLMANMIRYSIRNSGHSDTLFTISFVQLQLTVSVNIVIIIAPKFYLSW
uniref:Bestrophin homolog n=1 Tax=Heterorhabditis bacteriophora TaxID=37862 RepID=A0A1I7WTR7_HETBA